MSAKTPWFYCGKCGYKNGPHPFRTDAGKCEQCGAPASEPHSADYVPGLS